LSQNKCIKKKNTAIYERFENLCDVNFLQILTQEVGKKWKARAIQETNSVLQKELFSLKNNRQARARGASVPYSKLLLNSHLKKKRNFHIIHAFPQNKIENSLIHSVEPGLTRPSTALRTISPSEQGETQGCGRA
jgi:hypothetical protein